MLAFLAFSLIATPVRSGEAASVFDSMTCQYAASHRDDLGGLSEWASRVLSDLGADDGGVVWRNGQSYDLQPVIAQGVLSRRVLAYCRNNPGKTVVDAFATILRGATTPFVPETDDLWHEL